MITLISKFRFLMSMQTGPNKSQSMDNWLWWTGLGELVNVAVFPLLLILFNYLFPETISISSIAAGITLSIILLQGGLYWILQRGQIWNRIPATPRLYLLIVNYTINTLLICIVPLVIILQLLNTSPVNVGDSLIGTLYYVFALAEYVHYFIFKINMRTIEWDLAIRNKRLNPARMLREYRKAKNGK